MILYLLEDPEQTDDEVVAVHDQAYSDKADQRQLSMAYGPAITLAEPRYGRRARKLIVPGRRGKGRARDDGGEEIVEAERERGRPGADEYHFEEGVRELGGGSPET